MLDGGRCVLELAVGVTTLLAVPNVSEGRDRRAIDAIGAAPSDARLLDVHADPDHHRSVFTLAGAPGELAAAVLGGAPRGAWREIDLTRHDGVHPRVGALDVAPIVYLDTADRGAACAEALVLGDLLGDELGLPVFLYGELAGGRTRAELRRGGPASARRADGRGELRPDFGRRPAPPHRRRGAGRRAPAAGGVQPRARARRRRSRTPARSRRRSARAGAEGLPGCARIGLWLEQRGVAQVSTNVEDHRATPLAAVVAAVARHATSRRAELVGLAPRAAFEGFPAGASRSADRGTLEDACSRSD